MNKKRKIVKVSEEVMNEILNADGGFIKGGKKDFPGNSMIKTSTDVDKEDGMVWTTDDQRKSVSQQGYAYYNYRGFSYAPGSVSEMYIIEDDLNEEDLVGRNNYDDIFSRNKDTDVMSSIEPLEALSGSYDASDVLSSVNDLILKIKYVSEENYGDVLAITLKGLLSSVNLSELTSSQIKEIKDILNG